MCKRVFAQGLAVLALVLAGGSAAAAPASAGGCASVSASAVDQYCEMTPTAGGNRVPSSLNQTVAGTLPAARRRALKRTEKGRLLLALPARDRLHRGGAPGTSTSKSNGASVNSLSLSWPVIGVLAGIAGLLIVVAVYQRARRNT